MTSTTAEQTESVGAATGDSRPRVLVVDDSRLQRRILSASLQRWGFDVEEAGSGPEALERCAEYSPDFVISDWMMPGMNGPEFCQAFRAMERNSYGYFILLTSKSEAVDVAQGLDAGADDFLTKPVSGDELRARLNAGERILRMERELIDKNRQLSGAFHELQTLYDSLDSDLAEARKLQQSLVKERFRSFGESQVSLLLRPSGHVGGDLVGFFPINARRVALYAIDVSGHGVASALMTARLAGYLSGSSPEQNIALFEGEFGIYDAHPPEKIASDLNRITLEELQTETYFTLLFAEVDLISGDVKLVQAGHPHPAVQRAAGSVELIGDGGLPIGLIADAPYERIELKLAPGDRLIIVSDGVTECDSPLGAMYDEDGLCRMLLANPERSGPALLDALTWDLSRHAGGLEIADDISAVLFEFGGSKRNAD